MNVGSIASTSTYQPVQRMPEASEAKGPDNDGDADDGGASKAAPAPTVNTSGQMTGQLLNAIA